MFLCFGGFFDFFSFDFDHRGAKLVKNISKMTPKYKKSKFSDVNVIVLYQNFDVPLILGKR